MARSKPLVVSGVSGTKRHALSKTPVQKPPPIPPRTSIKGRSSVPRGAPAKQIFQLGSLPNVIPKMELPSRRAFSKPTPTTAPSKTAKMQKMQPLSMIPSADRSLLEKTSVHKPLKIVPRSKGSKIPGGWSVPTSTTRRSTQATAADKLPVRPGYVPRVSRVYRSSVGAAAQGNPDVIVNTSAAGARNPAIANQRPSINVSMSKIVGKTAERINTTNISVKKGDCRTGTSTRNQKLTAPAPVVYPHTIVSIPDPSWSPPPSPDLSSFPSQSWTIVVDMDAGQMKTPTKICGDETHLSIGDLPKLVAGIPDDSCGLSEVAVSSPLSLSPSSTVIETLENPAKPMVGSNGMVTIGSLSPAKEPSTEVSLTVCAATIVPPSMNGTTSMATLTKVRVRRQASPPTRVSCAANGILMRVRCAMETASTFFAPSRRAPQSDTETAAPKPASTNVSRIQKLFSPPLDTEVEVSKNPIGYQGS